MNRIVVVATAVALALLPGTARAHHGVESVRGGLRTGLFDPSEQPPIDLSGTLSISAQDGPSGTGGSVHHFVRNEVSGEQSRFRGEVDCLQVTGNTAVASGDITSSSNLSADFDDRFVVVVVDGGNPQGGMPADTATVTIVGEPNATDPVTCVTTGTFGEATFITLPVNGNLIVHDDV